MNKLLKNNRITCNNENEWNLVQHYLVKNGYIWSSGSIKIDCHYNFPCTILIYGDLTLTYTKSVYNDSISAKSILREEKLKKINNDYGI